VKKILLTLLACASLAITQVAYSQCPAPVVNSFSPNTGFIGSTVTIIGANFDANPANNQVFFGATQATVLTASFGQLTVRVPVGATTAPVSVKNHCNLTAYSSVSFNGIFCPTPLTTTTYQNVAFTLSGINGAYNMLSQDMDGDGKPDIVSEGFGSNFTIARNTSTPGNMSFTAYNLTSPGPRSVAVADFDGDGKRDLLSNGYVHRNLSTPGTVNMGAAISIGNIGYQCAAGDINGDGKIDAISGNGNNILIAMNTSTGPGVISFAAVITGPNVGSQPTGLQMADIDGDGKTDILGSQGPNDRAFSLRNITPVGSSTPVFEAAEFWYSGGTYPYRCQVADFDKDGKIDITTCNYSGVGTLTNAAVLRNTSVPGNISFAAAVTTPAPQSNYRIAVGDVNGDGLPDIVTKSNGTNVFSVYRNTSTGPGVVSFATRIDYTSSAQAEVSGIVIGDLDGDFVPDIATSGTNSSAIRVHRNTSSQVDNTLPTAACKNITVALSPAGTVTVTAAMIDNGSSDACGIGSVEINGAASVNFTCANIGANTVELKVTDRAGNVSTCTATVNVAPAAIIVAGQSTVCQGQTVSLNANLGDSYQWQKDGVDIAGATAQNYVATTSGNYTVTVTNGGGCSGTSAATVVVVNDNPTVDITPSGVASLCAPSNTAVLSASTSSIYQWKKDGVNIGGATQQNYTATAIGSYSVQVIDLFGCSATSSPVVVGATDNIRPTVRVRNLVLDMNPAKALSITAADINDGSFDNCSAVTVVLVGQAEFGCAEVGKTIKVQLQVTDANGNVGLATATVTITDTNKYCNQPPVAKAKALTLSAGADCTANASAEDFNDGSSDPDGDVITFSVSPAAPYAIGTTNVVFTVTDAKGESVSVNTTVTVVDNTKPTITAPSGVTTTADAGACAATGVVLGSAATADNCGVAGVTNNAPASFPVGTTTVTWTVTDIHGNSSTATQTVTVTDNEAPKANCKPVTVTLVNGGASITVADVNNNSTDNCGIAAVTISKASFNCTNLGANTVVLTVKDIHGNVSTCNATVTVVGEIPTCSIAAVPTDNTYTGGINTNLYLGYGAQNTTLKVTAPASGAPYTYSWSGAAVNKLSSTTSGAPVFTPTVAGVYTFTVVSTNKYGCTTSCSITICVKDIRVPGTDGKKVYVCHVPPGNPGNANTLSISVNAVAAHMEHSTDKLGTCDQVCGAPVTARTMSTPNTVKPPVSTTQTLSVKVETMVVSAELKANVSPNPTSSTFVVRAESSSKENVTIRIVDAAGKIHEMKNAGANTNVIMGGALKSGAYFIEVRQGNNKAVVKGIKLN
jgi:hypothetical protein